MDHHYDDSAVKQRITAHMNKDHQDSLAHYLQHYCNISPALSSTALLEDINYAHLIITSKAGRNFIPLEPPLKSWSEARTRLVSMHHECLQGLGLSSIVVRDYQRPSGIQLIVFVLAAFAFAFFSRRNNFVPGAFIHETFLPWVPAFSRFCYKIQPYVILFMDILHGSEAVWMAQVKLRRHQVPQFTLLWWKWVVSTFIEGVGAHLRFNELVQIQALKNDHKPKQ